jgi:hypothetical protein
MCSDGLIKQRSFLFMGQFFCTVYISYLRMLYLTMPRPYSIECYNEQCMMNWKGCGRKWPCSNFRYCPGIGLDGMSKITRTYVRFVGALAKIRTGDLPDTSQKRYCLRQLAQLKFVCC